LSSVELLGKYKENLMSSSGARNAIAVIAAITAVWGSQAAAGNLAGNDARRNQRRPQEEAIAAAPLPYRMNPVTFDNSAAAGVRLAGTLTLPPGAAPFPGVVLISHCGGCLSAGPIRHR
jgi:hypothetical protein